MSNGRILVVEDDHDIANLLHIFFTGQGYEVDVASQGNEALEKCRRKHPDLVLLDIMLPGDMDGYAICKALRTATRTSHIPIMFLTQKDQQSDRIAGFETGADDFITKPFDIEELALRIRTAIATYRHTNLSHPVTGLPQGELIEEQLRNLIASEDWSLLLMGIDMEDYNEAYGLVAGDQLMRFTAQLFNEIIDELGTLDDFLGQASNNILLLITKTKDIATLVSALRQRFSTEMSSPDNNETPSPFPSLSIGVVSGKAHNFVDIREITETAAELRRLDQESNS